MRSATYDRVVDLSRLLVPDELWTATEPLIPPHGVRRQGGGPRRADDRAVLTAIVFVLTTCCAWHQVPSTLGVSGPTAHRRFQEWTRAGLWHRLRRAVGEEVTNPGVNAWAETVTNTAMERAKERCWHALSLVSDPESRSG